MRSIALALICLAAPALAQEGAGSARSVEECERLQGFDEYNRCLARFGPPASAVGPGTARPPRGAEPAAEAETASATRPSTRPAARQAAARPSPAVRRAGRGRQSASFTIVTGRPRASRAASPRRTR